MQLDSEHKFFREMWGEYVSLVRSSLSPRSLAHYKQEFTNFCRWATMRDIVHSSQMDEQIAEEYIKYSYSIRRSAPFEISTLRRVWSVTLHNKPNPWSVKVFNLIRINTPTPEHHRPFTLRECRRIFKEAHGEYSHALRFAYWYGMRIGSCCNLKWIDFKGWKKTSRFVHLPPKTMRSKPVYLELPIVPEIEATLNEVERVDDFLFPELHEKYLRCLPAICHDFKTIVKKCGIRNSLMGRASVHSFRSTFITRMDEAGAPVYITDSVTGHAPRDMHGLYSKPSALAKKRWILRALQPVAIL